MAVAVVVIFMAIWCAVFAYLIRTDTPGWSRNKWLVLLWVLVLLAAVWLFLVPPEILRP